MELHADLRRLIIDSVLPPGSVLKQAELARAFGVSRTHPCAKHFGCCKRRV
ncbi:GntR family transcriptional regulator [Arthrobacter sp. NPDC056691]|uniref:GntR family transcriptional regulator n=1 Tax=Arthrobacter sp. NPDC056691 TaxID=3345913 RepID=UPI00366F63C2